MFTPDKYQNNRGLHQPQVQEENFNYTYSADRQIVRLLTPPLKLVLIFSTITIVLLVYIFGYSSQNSPIAYGVYVFSAYAFTVLCVNFKKLLHTTRELILYNRFTLKVKKILQRYKYTSMYLTSKEFRAKVSLYIGLGINMFYAVFKCGTGVLYHSAWFWANGVYYFMLGLTRFLMMRNIHLTDKQKASRSRKLRQYLSYRNCGIMILLLNVTMAGMAIQMVLHNRTYSYASGIVYISAGYTFYCFISAIANVVTFSKLNHPILLATKNLNLVGAVMSIFTLQTTMYILLKVF
jgi:hypothetical protein